MLKGLVSRIFRSGSARPGLPFNIPTAVSERTPAKIVPLPSTLQSPSQRNEDVPDQATLAVPEGLLDGIAALQQRYRKDMEYYGQTPAEDDASTIESPDIESLDVTAHIECIRKATGYTFKDPDLVRGAIFAGEKTYKGQLLYRPAQYQLAKLGDELFKSVHHSSNFPAVSSGDERFGTAWMWLTSNAGLHFTAQQLRLPQMLASSGHATRIKADGSKGFGTMVEAVIGGIYLDSGEDGAVTRTAMTRLLGTSMRRKDLEKFHETYRLQVRKPSPSLLWRTMRDQANAQVRHEEESGSLDFAVEDTVRDWIQEVRILKQISKKERRITLKFKRRPLPRLMRKIELMKRRHARLLAKRGRTKHIRGQAESILERIQRAEKQLKAEQDRESG